MNKTTQAARRRELIRLMHKHGYEADSEDGNNVRAFAEKVGYSYGSVRQWIANTKHYPSRHTLRTIKLLMSQ